MKQFTFTSQLAPIIWKYLESRQNEGYTSVHCGYYMQELDCLSKELSDAPVVTKELIDAWDLLKPYLSNRSKIVRHNAIRAFAKFAYTQDGISYVPDTSKLKNSSTFTPHIFTVEEIRRLLYAADNLPVRNNAPTRHLVIPAVIRLLYCCGFRIGEVLRLRVKDVDLDTGIITVHNGKGGKDRLVPVHNSVIEYLRSYSAQLPDEREWFFPSACGHYSIKTFYMPNDTIVDLIRTLIWYDWEHSLPFQDFGDSTQCFLLRIRLSCSHPAVKALLADWRIHRTAFENGRITSSDYLEWMLQWPPTLSAPDD